MQRLKLIYLLLFLFITCVPVYAQEVILDSDYSDWYFSIGKSKKQYLAIVPGSNINDLVCNQLIPGPYVDSNIDQIQWIEDSTFTYITTFDLQARNEFKYEIIFEGLDTYAEVFLNNQLLVKSNNMFVHYQKEITGLLRDGTNILKIVFKSVVEVGKQNAKHSNIIYPADNEDGAIKISPYIRKAGFQFGWDINPRLLSCGIWQPIKIVSTLKSEIKKENSFSKPTKPLHSIKMDDDDIGQSFAFYTNEKKAAHTFMFGANYVPYNMYPLPLKNYKRVAHIQKNQGLPNRHVYYEQLFSELKNYGCNMLRVWGGGWYEDDYFYTLADSMHIAIWQDFMFANTMYPGDEEWINNVKVEVHQQIERLSKHPCIVLWSGNNEIQVAWKNWGWQSKYHYSKNDSVKLIHDYQLLFDSIIPNELKKQNSKVKYIPSSPISNWGRPEDFKKGDNHYWGIWHGEAPLEDFNNHVPRFASEYGMPSLGVNASLSHYNTNKKQQSFQNENILKRMKSYKGMKLLNSYINEYLPVPTNDSALSYASRYIQFKALKMAYNAHLYNFPFCSGSLFWQFNESWPGITWAAIDFSGTRKIPPYQSDYALLMDEKGVLKIKKVALQKEVIDVDFIEFCLKDLSGGVIKKQHVKCNSKDILRGIDINPNEYIDTLVLKDKYLKISLKKIAANNELILWDTLLLLNKEKNYNLKKPTVIISKIDSHHLKISSSELVIGLYLESHEHAAIKLNQNFINLEAGEEKVIYVESEINDTDLNHLKYFSIFDLIKK